MESSRPQITRYDAYAEIILKKGPKDSDPNSFDARQVQQNLSAAIKRPAE